MIRFNLGQILVIVGSLACRPAAAADPARHEFERAEMGLPFRLVLYAGSETVAREAAEAAFGRIHALNGMLSDYDEASELSRLSATAGSGNWVPLGADLARVLRAADRAAVESEGAFDVTVGPLVQLWKRARRQRELPADAALARAREATGWRHLRLRRSAGRWEARLNRPGMRLDLGGIAKGYALDEAARVLKDRGVRRFLISGGGDMVAGDPPPGTVGWRIEVGVYDTAAAPPPMFVCLRNRALATSGDVFQRAEIGGRRYSHIVDPSTGIGLTDHSLVTVIAPTGMQADVLSTQLSVLGPSRGAALARTAGADFLLYRMSDETLERWRSRGFDRWLWPGLER
ncbi:MAG: FAD:protein FMN transferase [Verrucomicrobia bacterium]|nr:FAD:protein FMN transferase [Verrucomicrobiota bacterium]